VPDVGGAAPRLGDRAAAAVGSEGVQPPGSISGERGASAP
jgi:hypothetical protein